MALRRTMLRELTLEAINLILGRIWDEIEKIHRRLKLLEADEDED